MTYKMRDVWEAWATLRARNSNDRRLTGRGRVC